MQQSTRHNKHHLWKWENINYNGWELVKIGDKIPQIHIALIKDVVDDRFTWALPRRCRSTMTPLYARVWGNEIAYAKLIP